MGAAAWGRRRGGGGVGAAAWGRRRGGGGVGAAAWGRRRGGGGVGRVGGGVRDHDQMAIRAVLSDIGGVLERNPRTGWQQSWATMLGMERSELDHKLEPIWREGSIGAITLEQVEQRTAKALGLDEQRLAAFMGDAWGEYVGTLNEPLAAYFAGLRSRFRTGIVSNSFVGAREREQRAYNFESMCDVIVYSHEVGWMKPDPRIYRLACARLNVTPQEAVFVDDLQAGVDGALHIGMRAIKFEHSAQAIAELGAVCSE